MRSTNPKATILAVFIGLLIFSNQLLANVNVLIIGSIRNWGEKMLRLLIALATFGGLAHGTVFIETGFEGSSSLPAGWAQNQISGSATWNVQQGGGGGGTNPTTAHSGTNNATLYVTNTAENKTRLTSPAFDTVGYTNLSLTFWHTQALWSPDQDQLKVFFSSDGGTNWTELAYYTASVSAWTQRTLVIPSASANSRIAFEGNAKYGYGVCLDDIQVTGIPGSISEVSVNATDASASEVGPNPGTWTITRIGNTTGAASVNFTLSGTATQGADYTVSPPSPINFAAGETSKEVTLTTLDDMVEAEGNEVATLTLSSGAGYVIGAASGSISIYDDEGYDLNVLIIGSTHDSSEQLGGNSKPFSPAAIGTELQSILSGSGLGSVNVAVMDRYATGTTIMGSNTYAYNLASWFHWPFPKGAESARWANLRGEAGTVWDYVVLIGDPYTMEYTPGAYAQGAAKIAEEVAKGSAETILLMPWPASGSSRSIAHYKDVVYRAGRSGGIKVAPGGLAWQAIKGAALTNPNPNADGAFIAAASIYSTIYNQSAAVSTYVYNDTWANTVNTTESSNRNAQQYTGGFSFQNPYLFRSDSKRKIYFSSRGSSTEGYFQGAANSAIGRCRVGVSSSCPWNRSEADWATNGGDEPWTKWPADFVPPIAWNDGRDGVTAEWYKSYQVNPAYWDFAYGYEYQANTWSKSVEDANDHFVSMMLPQDNMLAHRMISEGNSARNLPVRTLWAQIHKEFPSENPLMDGSGPHLNQLEHEAVGTYMYALYSGRCPLDPEPATLDKTWVARKIGYETAWRLGRCQMRAPGFKVMPSATAKKSIIPGEKETMTVQFILPTKQDVTVNVSISNSNAAIVGSNQLVFTPQNYNVPQNVVVAGLPGSAASDTFNVVFTTVSTDEVCNGLSDTWDYTITRSTPVTLTRVDKGTTQVTANQNLPLTINLNTAGASSSNTTLAGPSRGSAVWSGSNVIYTPSSDFVGKDGFSFATNNAGTLSVGYIEITVSSAVPNGMVSYRGNGNEGGAVPIDSNTYAQNATVTILGNTGNLIKTGYNFNGWNTAADGSGATYNANSTFTMGASGVILYAQWTAAPTYTVTFNGNVSTSGSVPYDQIKTDGVNLTLATNIGTLAKNGYTFAGWNTLANGTGDQYAAGGTYSGNANVTLYAKWTPNNYTVTFNANGGGTPSPTSKVVTYASTYGDLATITYPGFSLNGWFTAATGGTKILPATTVNITSNQTLYAQWTVGNSYTVSYHANGADAGSVPADQSKLENATLTLATNSGGLTLTNYTFTGWNTAADGSGDPYAAGAPYTANAAVTLYAQWALNTYAVTYNGNGNTGGTVPSSQSKTHGINLTLSDAGTMVRTGYTFINWNTAPDGSGASYTAGAAYSTDAVVTLYAQWTALPTYTVTYNGNGSTGGSAPLNQTKIQGINLTLSGAGTLVRTGYAFANWTTQANGSGTSYAAGATYSIDGPLTLYAQWTLLPTYTITYSGNGSTGGSAPSDQTKIQGTDLTLSGAGTLVRTGYTFSNWNTAANGSGDLYVAGATYTADVPATLHAQWTINTYVVTYDGNGNTGGTPPADQIKTHDIALNLATNTGTLSRTGYTFAGWNTQADGLGASYAVGAAYTTNSTLTLYSKWTANSYTVTFDANGGDAPSPSSNSVTFGSTYGTLATISRAGYTFNGWFTAASGGTAVTSSTTVTNAANHTLYAQWTASSYTITFDANGGDTASPTSKSVTYGSTYGTLATSSRAGYTFNGWFTAASGGTEITSGTTVAITSAQTLYAQWTVGVLLTWDANGTGTDQTNGAGAWGTVNLWWNGITNNSWQSGASAKFGGPNTAGGAVTLAAPTTVENFTFNTFTGTYTLGTSGQTITLNSGITKNASSGIATIISPITLGAAQAWTNNNIETDVKAANGTLNITGGVDNAGSTLTFDGTGTTSLSNTSNFITGSGGLTKNGAGVLILGAGGTVPVHNYSGTITLNGGGVRINGATSYGTGNLTINHGYLESYYGTSFTRTLGSGVGQVQILGGVSGFSEQGLSSTVTLNNDAAFEVVWGGANEAGNTLATGFFNPSCFVLQSGTVNSGKSITFANKLDLNGTTRTIYVGKDSATFATLSGVVRSSTGTAGLTKEGDGTLILSAANTYTGDTTISSGNLRIGNNTAGTLNNGNYAGNISIASGATLQIWSTANQTLSGTISGAGNLHKAYGGTLTLSGPNTYTGRTSFLPQTTAGFTVNITSFNSVNGGTPTLASSSLGAPTTIANGTIDIGDGGKQAGVNLSYTGPGETTDRVINFGFNGTASQTLSASGSGLLKFTSAMTSNATTQTGKLILDGTGSGEITQTLPALPTGGLTKNGTTGTWTLGGANSYTGPTAITAGKLFINGDQTSATGTVTVSANATLGGTGTLGGNTTIDVGGKLEFNLSTAAASHNPLDLIAGKALTFSGASTLTITSTGGASPGLYTLLTAPGGITGSAPATLNLPNGWAATVSIAGNSLQLNVTSTGSGAIDHFAISSIASPQTVGTAITGITLTAQDAANLTITSFTGTVAFGGTAGITGTSANFVSGVLTGVSVIPVNVGAGLNLTVNDGSSHTGSATFTVRSVFDNWAGVSGLTGGNAAAGANPDGDNLTNLLEFAFGTNPTSPRLAPLSYVANGTTIGGTPILEKQGATYRAVFARRKDYIAAGLTYTVTFSADLIRWTENTLDPLPVRRSGINADIMEAVSIDFPTTVPLQAGGNAAPQFFRVAVTGN